MTVRFSLILTTLIVLFACSERKEYIRADFVSPFIGTGGHGHTYPGPSAPFGMVQLSPDTRLTGWDGCSGYHISDSIIYGFSHTHLSGTGISDYGDILFMPTVGEINLNNGEDGKPGYRSTYKHTKQRGTAGYYKVHLEDYNITVELTTTQRVGFHRYTYPNSDQANIILDLKHRDQVITSGLHIVDDDEIEGYRISSAWAKEQHVYFVARFSKSFEKSGIAINDVIQEGLENAEGTNIKAYFTFSTKSKEQIKVKVGLSAVSIEGARLNLKEEVSGWDFADVRDQSKSDWDEILSKIDIEGGSRNDRIVFYSALYHSFLSPNIYMDVDGKFRGMDLLVHRAPDYKYYTVFSLWDTYRATHPLFTIIDQERTRDFIRTFIRQYSDGGILPIWELAGNYTGCMIGYHSIPVIVDAYLKGIRGYEVEDIYKVMKISAGKEHHGLDAYKAKGYISSHDEGESVSKTLEYAYDDWCIAMMAKKMRKDEDYQYYVKRAQSYKNLLDPNTGFMRARDNEMWYSPFDPAEVFDNV
ncbi:MAG: GH92 family glycosyl hydrolase, partial [Bacteroidetes bacterium]|nr:GH92 family glycosyl hydrolase [Bacteroidota bacterium]